MLIVILLRKFKEQWEKWDLRSFILLSLFLQVFINIFAPLRKRTKNPTITALIWISYLLSDWAANYAVALISSSQNEVSPKHSRSSSNNNSDLLAFWAPFLMVHLGGPDTITALAVEDNKLWLRHFFSLIFQSLAAIYVFVQSLPDNQLLIPTVLMFISGLYRYSERLVSLYSATSDSDAGPDYARLMEELQSKLEANLPVYIEMIPVNDEGRTKSINRVKTGDLSDTEVVLYAHKFFNFLNLRDLAADLIIGVRERKRFRDFFLMRNAKDAFKVIEVELNFIYEVLFTKVSGVYNKSGYCRRFISFALVVASFLFFKFADKKDFKRADVGITYTLLIGAIVLDITAFIRIFTSDWFIAKTKKLTDETNRLPKKTKKPDCGFFNKIFPLLGRRWSGNVSTYNLISCCLKRRDKKMDKFIEMLDFTDLFDSHRNVKSSPFDENLKEHIFKELHMKSEIADDLDTAKEIASARGDWILRFRHCGKLLHHVVDMDFDQSLLIWHIATEICYHDQEISIGENKQFRDFSKLLSDYMVYLLIKQPQIMSAVSGIGQIRFRDTCAEAKMFFFQDDSETMNKPEPEPSDFQVITYVVSMFFKRLLSSPYNLLCFVVDFFIGFFVGAIVKCVTGRGEMMKRRVDRYCSKDTGDEMRSEEEKFSKKILGVHTEVEPVVIKGDRSKSVLFDGCILAKEMIGMQNSKWKIMSEVWVEMLCYAAMRCTPNTHAIELSKGGELVTIVWLLMIHFGFGKQFNDSGGHLKANIIGAK